MKAQQTLRRPSNWQDFESLCKILWGEIWNCPEIQKNGRLGQEQAGVDVFGIPSNDDSYYGIQCKGKSEYNDNQYEHPQFTEQEIQKEIEKAKTFLPALKKFYLATTALNDAKIQAFVRQKNIEHRNKGLFEIHLFCWETIVDLIDENKRTHDYYVKSQNYKTNQSVAVTFENGETEIICKPKFKKQITHFRQKIVLAEPNSLFDSILKQQAFLKALTPKSFSLKEINKSYFGFTIKIHNNGKDPIEEYKLLLNFEGDILELKDRNDFGMNILALPKNYVYTTYLWFESLSGKLVPRKPILVGDDTFSSERIYIKTKPVESEITIKWKLLSKDYKDEGILTIKVKPQIITKYEDILVEDPFKVKIVEGEIEDFITDKDDSD